MFSNNVIYDTNILSVALDSDSSAEKFFNKLFNENIGILIPEAILMELANVRLAGNSAEVIKKLNRLSRFKDLNSTKFDIRIGNTVPNAISKEYVRYGALTKFPEFDDDKQEYLFSMFRNDKLLKSHIDGIDFRNRSSKILNANEKLLKDDIEQRRFANSMLDKEFIVEQFTDSRLSLLSLSYEQLEIFWDSYFPIRRPFSKRMLSKVFSSKKRYKVSKAFLGASIFRRLARFLDGNVPKGSRFTQLPTGIFQIKNGDWVDNHIIAAASYSDLLITDDKGLFDFCKFLKFKGIISFEVVHGDSNY